jgi:hypothetical protein
VTNQPQRDEQEAYFIEVENKGCSHCGANRMWRVVGPDGVAMSTIYERDEDAADLAEDLNIAYAAGRAFVQAQVADAVERAARVADNYTIEGPIERQYEALDASREIAESIRALQAQAPQEPSKSVGDALSGFFERGVSTQEAIDRAIAAAPPDKPAGEVGE